MSSNSVGENKLQRIAPVFAAMGDETRLSLLHQMSNGDMCSVTQLTAGRQLTRQAVRKHLQVLERAKLVRSIWRGRENLFQVELETLKEASRQLQLISAQWEDALNRLKDFLEKTPDPASQENAPAKYPPNIG